MFASSGSYLRTAPFVLTSANQVLTYSFWSKTVGTGDYQSFVGESWQPSDDWFIWIFRGSNAGGNDKLYFQYATETGVSYQTYTLSNYFIDDQWIHTVIVADYANNIIYFYKNGVLAGTHNSTYDVQFPGRNVAKYFGAYASSAHYIRNWQLDEVRIYNRSLSTGETRELYASAQTLYQTGECNDTTATLHPW